MKVLALGDPHGKLPKNLDRIVEKNKIELIVCVGEVFPIKRNGDKTGFADFEKGELILKKLLSYKLPLIVFKGNMFLTNEGSKYFKDLLKKFKNKNLYYKETGVAKIKGKAFVLFDMIYEKHSHSWLEEKFRRFYTNSLNDKRFLKLCGLLKKHKNSVLLSHAPPFGYVDKIHSGKHIGSKILFRAIRRYQPRLVLCGHIHEAKGKARIGKTPVINLGYCGDYEVLDL